MNELQYYRIPYTFAYATALRPCIPKQFTSSLIETKENMYAPNSWALRSHRTRDTAKINADYCTNEPGTNMTKTQRWRRTNEWKNKTNLELNCVQRVLQQVLKFEITIFFLCVRHNELTSLKRAYSLWYCILSFALSFARFALARNWTLCLAFGTI